MFSSVLWSSLWFLVRVGIRIGPKSNLDSYDMTVRLFLTGGYYFISFLFPLHCSCDFNFRDFSVYCTVDITCFVLQVTHICYVMFSCFR